MNSVIIILTLIEVVGGLLLSIQTIINTRKQYYNEYIKRKRNEEN